MKYLYIIIISVIFIFSYKWLFLEKEDILTIHLRCDNNISGSLLINTVTRSSNSFDLKQACLKKEIIFKPYLKKQKLLIKLKTNDGHEIKKITTEYGRKIQSDPSGLFYMILKITNSSPFLVVEGI